MASSRLRAFTAQIDAAKKLTSSGEIRKRELIRISEQAFQDADAINRAALGRTMESELFVNGRKVASLESVQPGNIISFVWAVHNAAIDFAFETLAALSPVDTGHYVDSHKLFVNGVEAEPPVSVSADDETMLINVAAYARRLEHGWSKFAPDGVYEVASAIIKKRFGALVDVKFTYVPLVGGEVERGKRGNNPKLRYPAIILRPKRQRLT